MKIIGKTNDGFILESSSREVFNFIGYYSEYSENRPVLKVGDRLKVSEMYTQLHDLACKEKAIAEVAKVLTEIIGKLQVVDPIFKGLIPNDKGATE